MRNSYRGKFIFGDNGLIGVNLGADYCAEHEWGIKEFNRYLGINSEADFGLPRRKINKTQHLSPFENDKVIGFILHSFLRDEYRLEWKPRDGFIYSDDSKSFYAGWSGNGSGTGLYLLTDKPTKKIKSEKTVERISQIYDALKSINAVVWLGGGGVFENAGLCIGVVDKMPKSIFDDWAAIDKQKYDVKVAFEKTGIEKLLADAGKHYFALSPSMNGKKLKVWLNPYEQHKYEAGWFTIDELKLWAKDQGPVMKQQAKQKR